MVSVLNQLVPVKVSDGRDGGPAEFVFTFSADWSSPLFPNTSIADFGTQAYGDNIEYVRGAWIDNSGSTNDVIFTVPGMNQQFKVYAGSIVTVPLFTLALPKIILQNQNNGTANTGIINVIFTTKRLDAQILVSGTDAGAAAPVIDTALITALTSPGVVIQQAGAAVLVSNPLGTQKGTIGTSWVGTQTVLTASTVQIASAAQYVNDLIIQNIGTNSANILWQTTAPTISAANSIVIAAGATFSVAANVNRMPTPALYGASLSGGTTLNLIGH